MVEILKSSTRPLSTFILPPHINNFNVFVFLGCDIYNSATHVQIMRKNIYEWHYVIAIEMGYTWNIGFIFDMAYYKALLIIKQYIVYESESTYFIKNCILKSTFYK